MELKNLFVDFKLLSAMDSVNINHHLDFGAISTVALNCCLLGKQIAILVLLKMFM